MVRTILKCAGTALAAAGCLTVAAPLASAAPVAPVAIAAPAAAPEPRQIAAGAPPTVCADHVPDSARQLASYVDRMLAATGASKVDLVGHSQGGGVTSEWYLRFDGGAAKVHRLVGINASNHGTDASGPANLLDPVLDVVGWAGKRSAWTARRPGTGRPAPRCSNGSHAKGDTERGVDYTTIVSRTRRNPDRLPRTCTGASEGARSGPGRRPVGLTGWWTRPPGPVRPGNRGAGC